MGLIHWNYNSFIYAGSNIEPVSISPVNPMANQYIFTSHTYCGSSINLLETKKTLDENPNLVHVIFIQQTINPNRKQTADLKAVFNMTSLHITIIITFILFLKLNQDLLYLYLTEGKKRGALKSTPVDRVSGTLMTLHNAQRIISHCNFPALSKQK